MLLLHQSMHSLVSQLIHLVSVSSFVPVEVYDGQELTALNALKQAKKKKKKCTSSAQRSGHMSSASYYHWFSSLKILSSVAGSRYSTWPGAKGLQNRRGIPFANLTAKSAESCPNPKNSTNQFSKTPFPMCLSSLLCVYLLGGETFRKLVETSFYEFPSILSGLTRKTPPLLLSPQVLIPGVT